MHMRSGDYVLVQEFVIPRTITFQYQMIFVSISEYNPSEYGAPHERTYSDMLESSLNMKFRGNRLT